MPIKRVIPEPPEPFPPEEPVAVPVEEPVYEAVADEVIVEVTEEELTASAEMQKKYPESLCSLSTDIHSSTGARIILTIRSSHFKPALEMLSRAIKYAETEYGLKTMTSVSNKTPAQPQQGTETPEQKAASYDAVIIETGTSTLRQITVSPDPKKGIQFEVGAFNYPFTDHRTPEKIAAMFSSDIGFTAEDFSVPAVYTPANWGPKEVVVDWVKKLKNNKNFWDIVKAYYK